MTHVSSPKGTPLEIDRCVSCCSLSVSGAATKSIPWVCRCTGHAAQSDFSAVVPCVSAVIDSSCDSVPLWSEIGMEPQRHQGHGGCRSRSPGPDLSEAGAYEGKRCEQTLNGLGCVAARAVDSTHVAVDRVELRLGAPRCLGGGGNWNGTTEARRTRRDTGSVNGAGDRLRSRFIGRSGRDCWSRPMRRVWRGN